MKRWCEHITPPGDGIGWVMLIDAVNRSVVEVPRSWKVCPICEAPRPTKANIKAAKLRFEMDNDN